MVTEHERQQLADEYARRPISVLGLLLTCAGGLLAVVALAVIGVEMNLFGAAQTEAVTAQRSP